MKLLCGFCLVAFRVAATDTLPAGEDVLAKFVEATGGRPAYEKIHSMISKGSMSMAAQNLKATVIIYEAEPSRQVSVVEFPGIGKIEEGTDGKIAWSSSALQGARLKSGEERDAAIRAANGESKFIHWQEFYTSVQTAGVEDVDGKPAYRLVLTPKSGKPETEFYDKTSGLLVKSAATMVSPMGEISVATKISDYRKEGAILMPHKLQQSAAGQQFEINIESVTLNADIPKGRFEPPADVKALIK